ncbi:hypothetical protein RVZ54_001755 [Listeria monocytogenes]|nr:hypothetical protein [Listeria monocytogenes]ELK8002330.1 hypothetical protein [Listeria monocytogenes]ELK8010534.1 hypothetical protein [Listeria monocytogenes]ELK8013415.1 hypothetical protein [Listeria monocytogenes]ELK8016277.1 hypothetical protein [Listeria monocytogenes]
MIAELKKYKKIIEDAVDLLGYTPLRYAIFEREKINRIEYQVRIEYIENHYEVYTTGERASISGKKQFENFFEAYHNFLFKLQLSILQNRRQVRGEQPPEYHCSLWDKCCR